MSPPAPSHRPVLSRLAFLHRAGAGARAAAEPPPADAAPHVRDGLDLETAARGAALALVPAAVLALHGTGRAMALALQPLGRARADGWRGDVLAALGLAPDPGQPLACLLLGALQLLPLFAASLVAGAFWQVLFDLTRGRPRVPGLVGTALLFTLLAPPGTPPWMLALAVSFGLVLAQEAFGGTGHQVLPPVVVGLLFLAFAWPAQVAGPGAWVPVAGSAAPALLELVQAGGPAALHGAAPPWSTVALLGTPGTAGGSAAACLAGALLLVLWRLVSWRVLAGGLLGMAAMALLLTSAAEGPASPAALPWHWHLVLGGLPFGLAFLVTDPRTGAATNPGRWLHGALFGVLVVLLRAANPSQPDGTLLALLLASVAAPLLDAGVVALHVHRRRRRARA